MSHIFGLDHIGRTAQGWVVLITASGTVCFHRLSHEHHVRRPFGLLCVHRFQPFDRFLRTHGRSRVFSGAGLGRRAEGSRPA